MAQYADACNLFPSPELAQKLEVLPDHCEALGRDYAAIGKTAVFIFEVGDNGDNVEQLIGQLHWLASMGIETVIGSVKDVWKISPLEIMGNRVLPAVADLRPGSP